MDANNNTKRIGACNPSNNWWDITNKHTANMIIVFWLTGNGFFDLFWLIGKTKWNVAAIHSIN